MGMLNDMDRDTLAGMATSMCISPAVYAVAAFFLDPYSVEGVPRVELIFRIILGVSLVLLVASRPVEKLIAPDPSGGRGPGARKAAIATLVVCGTAEMISVAGLAAVIIGVPFKDTIPLFIVSLLSFLEFRLFRLDRLLENMPGAQDS